MNSSSSSSSLSIRISEILETIQPYLVKAHGVLLQLWEQKAYPFLLQLHKTLRPHLEKAFELLVKFVLEPLWRHIKKLSWSQRIVYVVLICVAYDVMSVASAKSRQQKVIQAAIGVEEKSIIVHNNATNTSWWSQGKQPQLCEEEGTDYDEVPVADSNHPHAHICKCTDPTVPIAATDRGEIWMNHHNTMVHDVEFATATHKQLDVVLLGDSLIEHWNGTHRWGTLKKPALREVFEAYFTKVATTGATATGEGATLEAIALGSSADTSPNLLWHLQNGVLPQNNNLQPRLFVILIGTNDLVGTKCSIDITTKGIVAVAEYVASQRPNTPILIHGLLPRGDGHRNQPFALGREWNRIQQVNALLKEVCDLHPHWHYWDTGDFFLTADKTSLHTRLVADGIHPRISGMKLWGPKLVQAIHEVLEQEQKENNENGM